MIPLSFRKVLCLPPPRNRSTFAMVRTSSSTPMARRLENGGSASTSEREPSRKDLVRSCSFSLRTPCISHYLYCIITLYCKGHVQSNINREDLQRIQSTKRKSGERQLVKRSTPSSSRPSPPHTPPRHRQPRPPSAVPPAQRQFRPSLLPPVSIGSPFPHDDRDE